MNQQHHKNKACPFALSATEHTVQISLPAGAINNETFKAVSERRIEIGKREVKEKEKDMRAIDGQ